MTRNQRDVFKDISSNLTQNRGLKSNDDKLLHGRELVDSGICLTGNENKNESFEMEISVSGEDKVNEDSQPGLCSSGTEINDNVQQEPNVIPECQANDAPPLATEENDKRSHASVVPKKDRKKTLTKYTNQINYVISCQGCNKKYFGHTEDNLQKVMNDFKKEVQSVKNGKKGRPVAQHFAIGDCGKNEWKSEIQQHEPIANLRIQYKRNFILQHKEKEGVLNTVVPKKRNVFPIRRALRNKKITGRALRDSKITEYYSPSKVTALKK